MSMMQKNRHMGCKSWIEFWTKTGKSFKSSRACVNFSLSKVRVKERASVIQFMVWQKTQFPKVIDRAHKCTWICRFCMVQGVYKQQKMENEQFKVTLYYNLYYRAYNQHYFFEKLVKRCISFAWFFFQIIFFLA